VVPVDSSDEANSSSYVPFSLPTGDPTQRYQQVYRANNFGGPALAGGGVWLDHIYFRADTTNHFLSGPLMEDVQVNLSTTLRGPDGLSPVFADNVGADDKLVFGRGSLRFVVDWHPAPGPQNFSFAIPFSPPFFYDPANGNLLLDVRIFQVTNTSPYGPLPLDAWDRTNDPVSSLWATSVDANSGTLSTVGLATAFEGQLVSKLGFQQSTNRLTLSWTAQYDYRLQQTNALGTGCCWQTITNGIVQTNFVNRFTIPFDSMAAAAFFRLVFGSP